MFRIRNSQQQEETFDDADAVYDGRVVTFVDEMSSTYCLDAKCRLAEVDFTSSIVEVERRKLVARQAATHTDRQTTKEAEFISDGDRRPLSVDCSHSADLMSDRVDVYGAVQQSVVFCQQLAMKYVLRRISFYHSNCNARN